MADKASAIRPGANHTVERAEANALQRAETASYEEREAFGREYERQTGDQPPEISS